MSEWGYLSGISSQYSHVQVDWLADLPVLVVCNHGLPDLMQFPLGIYKHIG